MSFLISSPKPYDLTVNDKTYRCSVRESPIAPGSAAYVEYAQPGAPIRLTVSPGDIVRVSLKADWTTTRRVKEEQFLLDGEFTVPDEPHKMGSPGYNVDVPHLGTHMYFCIGNIGTPEDYHTEILSWSLTLLY